MANAHTHKRRRVSDISSAASRVRKLACDTPLPWDKIAPQPVAEWLDVYAQAKQYIQGHSFSKYSANHSFPHWADRH